MRTSRQTCRFAGGRLSRIVIVVCGMAGAAPAAAAGGGYTFTGVADSGGPFANFQDGPAVNDAGVVAFAANLDAGGSGVFTGVAGGAPPATVADTSGPFVGFTLPSINNAGTVAFYASKDAFSGGIYARTGAGPVAPIAETGPALARINHVGLINAAGVVAFDAESGLRTLYTGSAGRAPTPVIDSSGPLNYFYSVSINDAGTVTFSADGDSTPHAIYTVPAGGGAATPIAQFTDRSFYGTVSTNSAGTTAFTYQLVSNNGTDYGGGVATVGPNGGAPQVLADEAGAFEVFHAAAINDGGRVVFLADLDNGLGLFTGPDPLADRIIAVGDPLFGSTVSNVYFGISGLNEAGQVAFYYTLANGVSGIALASPVPEPGLAALSPLLFVALARRRRTPMR